MTVREPENVVIYVRDSAQYVEQVDYFTRKSTGRPMQFRAVYSANGYTLQPLPPDQWVAHPTRLDVDTWAF